MQRALLLLYSLPFSGERLIHIGVTQLIHMCDSTNLNCNHLLSRVNCRPLWVECRPALLGVQAKICDFSTHVK